MTDLIGFIVFLAVIAGAIWYFRAKVDGIKDEIKSDVKDAFDSVGDKIKSAVEDIKDKLP